MTQFLFTAHCQERYCALHTFASTYHGCILDPDSHDWNKITEMWISLITLMQNIIFSLFFFPEFLTMLLTH